MGVAVVIPTANNPIDLAVLLVQLQSQTRLPDRIYIADNSKDQYGVKLAKRYQFSVPIFVDPHPGAIYRSWNAGIEFAGKDSVLILNDDLLIGSDFVHNMISSRVFPVCPSADGFPPISITRDEYEWVNQSDWCEKCGRCEERHHSTFFKFHEEYRYVPTLQGWSFYLPRNVINKIGYFDEQFSIWYGDKDYEHRIFDAGLKIKFTTTKVSHFGTTSYSKIDADVFRETNYEDQVKYEKKYHLPHQDLGWG